jgi:hypothetical protein
MSITRKFVYAIAATILVTGFATSADAKMSASKHKRAMQANAQLVQAPRSTVAMRNAIPNMIVLGVGF